MSSKKKPPKPVASAGPRRFIRLRLRVWGCLAALAVCGVVGHFVWRHYAPVVARHPQYQLTADNVQISRPPAWIRCDVKAEILRDAGVTGTFSLLEDWDALCRRLTDASRFHPWVASVGPIHRRLPSTLEIELEYRQPVAAVESTDSSGVAFLPIDIQAVRLPEADIGEIDLRYLPRITGIAGRPLLGDTWRDERVTGGAKLAAALTDVWQQLRLVGIVPSSGLESHGGEKFYTFEIITSGGTRIVWGAAPGQEALAGESTGDVKRQRLLDFAAQNGRLDSIDGPALVDVRSELIVTPRTARRKSEKSLGSRH
jgi:hypothetical protein